MLVSCTAGGDVDDDAVSDLEYLTWEVCRQVRSEGMTADRVSGILVDALRHGEVMERIEADCGEEIAAFFAG